MIIYFLGYLYNYQKNTSVIDCHFTNDQLTQNNQSNVVITVFDIIRSTVSVGYNNNRSFIFPKYVKLMKIPYIISLFDLSSNNLRLKSEIYELEASEKNTISYDLGMIFAHLLSDKKINIKWSIHLSLAESSGFNVNISNRKPDLIVEDINNNYHIVEAKGTLYKCKKDTVSKGRKQVESISLINNQNPIGKYISYFVAPKNDNIKLYWIDPEEEGNTKLYLSEKEKIFIHYYKFIQLLLDNELFLTEENIEEFNEENIKFKGINLGNIFIGIDIELFNILRNTYNEFKKNKKDLNTIKEKINLFNKKVQYFAKQKEKLNNKNISIGNDGIIVYGKI